MTLTTKRLILRELCLGDANTIGLLANDYDIAYNSLTVPFPQPKDWATSWVGEKLALEKAGLAKVFVITMTDEIIGFAILKDIDKQHHFAEIGYWMGKSFRGKGYVVEAINAIFNYGFDTLDLNRIYAYTFTSNQASLRVMEKLGMSKEGILRQGIYKDGSYIDSALFSILKHEFEEQANV